MGKIALGVSSRVELILYLFSQRERSNRTAAIPYHVRRSKCDDSGCPLQRCAKFAEEPESSCQTEVAQRSRVDYFRGAWIEMGSTFT